MLFFAKLVISNTFAKESVIIRAGGRSRLTCRTASNGKAVILALFCGVYFKIIIMVAAAA